MSVASYSDDFEEANRSLEQAKQYFSVLKKDASVPQSEKKEIKAHLDFIKQKIEQLNPPQKSSQQAPSDFFKAPGAMKQAEVTPAPPQHSRSAKSSPG